MRGSKSAAGARPTDTVFKEDGEDPKYDVWFRDQVQIGLAAIAHGETAAHEDVRARWRKKRAELVRRIRET